jgi:hypothetical protein
MQFQFTCATCGKIHAGTPSFGAEAPLSYYEIPEQERESRCILGTDNCVIDAKWFFIRGCLEIPVHGHDEPLVWGVWISLSEKNYARWVEVFDQDERSHIGPFFGWLSASLNPYPETASLKTLVHLRDHGLRPTIEVEPTDHPLAIEQRNGITVDRVADIYIIMMHNTDDGTDAR